MTKNSNITRPLFAIAAALVAAPLAAREPMTVTGQSQSAYQERVSFADLDLRQWKAQQLLKGRVYRAADRLCSEAEGPFSSINIGLGSSLNCTDRAYNAARPQIAVAINRARIGQNLAGMTLVISAMRTR